MLVPGCVGIWSKDAGVNTLPCLSSAWNIFRNFQIRTWPDCVGFRPCWYYQRMLVLILHLVCCPFEINLDTCIAEHDQALLLFFRIYCIILYVFSLFVWWHLQGKHTSQCNKQTPSKLIKLVHITKEMIKLLVITEICWPRQNILNKLFVNNCWDWIILDIAPECSVNIQ